GGFCVSRGRALVWARFALFVGNSLHRHYARFFGGFNGFARRGNDRALSLFANVDLLRLTQLQLRFAQNRRSVLVSIGDMRDAHRIASFEELNWSLAIDTKDRVIDACVRGTVGTTADKLELSVDI